MIIVDSCMIWFHFDCIMQLKKSYHIATNVCSRKSATSFGDLPDWSVGQDRNYMLPFPRSDDPLNNGVDIRLVIQWCTQLRAIGADVFYLPISTQKKLSFLLSSQREQPLHMHVWRWIMTHWSWTCFMFHRNHPTSAAAASEMALVGLCCGFALSQPWYTGSNLYQYREISRIVSLTLAVFR